MDTLSHMVFEALTYVIMDTVYILWQLVPALSQDSVCNTTPHAITEHEPH